MLLKRIDLKAVKEDFRKLGVNFITAGVIGIFVNHYVGTKLSTMLWTAFWVTGFGVWFLLIGYLTKSGDNKL